MPLRIILLFALLLPWQAEALCVSASQANLRAKPSANSKLVWTVGKYMPLLEIKQQGNWIQVRDLDGKKMWIHGGLVSTSIDCAVIKVGRSSLRKGPGTKYSKTALNYAHKYMPFRKLDRDGAWLKLQDDYGFKHWVYETNVWEPLYYSSISY